MFFSTGHAQCVLVPVPVPVLVLVPSRCLEAARSKLGPQSAGVFRCSRSEMRMESGSESKQTMKRTAWSGAQAERGGLLPSWQRRREGGGTVGFSQHNARARPREATGGTGSLLVGLLGDSQISTSCCHCRPMLAVALCWRWVGVAQDRMCWLPGDARPSAQPESLNKAAAWSQAAE